MYPFETWKKHWAWYKYNRYWGVGREREMHRRERQKRDKMIAVLIPILAASQGSGDGFAAQTGRNL
jgi:hypothetical protein